ncbi:MAG: Gfo/Idh/MocA family oxidoreductase [Cyclobacteriaceae bacterium]|nr:Gfo/Idh/MocA family oxidoreductase [Cyclobacteriaceae bacterium]
MTGFSQDPRKVRLGVAGMTHGHVNWILGSMEGRNYEVVGFAEKNDTLARRLFSNYNISEELRYHDLTELIQQTAPDGILAFNSIYEHREVVEISAPLGIHVMVEKPLAVNPDHASEMAGLAKEHDIFLLTNYETTWYGTTPRVMDEIVDKRTIGDVRKIVVRDGHQGPREIGVNNEFFVWLTDPELNGGGALIDFGCYGANLITRIMENQRPGTVTAVTQQIKPHIYPDVDDEATIILTYPNTVGIIQASWNWPFSRKDMDVYGTAGAVYQYDRDEMAVSINQQTEKIRTPAREFPSQNPFTYFAAVILREIKVMPEDLSSLENNLIVVEILDAARRSAKDGKRIDLE